MSDLRGGLASALLGAWFFISFIGCGGPPSTDAGPSASDSGGESERSGEVRATGEAERQGSSTLPDVWSARPDPASIGPESLPSLDAYPIKVDRGYSVDFALAARPTALATKGGGVETEVQCIDLETGRRSSALRMGESIPPQAVVSPNRDLIAGKLLQAEDRIRVWSFTSGRVASDHSLPAPLSPRTGPVQALRFAGDGRLIAFRRAAHGGEAIVLSTGAAMPARQIPLPSLFDDACGVSPGGRYLAVLGASRLFAYEIESGVCCGAASFDPDALGEGGACTELVFSNDGGEIAALVRHSTGDVRLLVWDFSTGKLALTKTMESGAWRRRHPNFVQQHDAQPLAWLPDKSGWVLYGRFVWRRDADSPTEEFPEPEDASVRRLVDARHAVTIAVEEAGERSLRLLSLDDDDAGLAATETKTATDGAWKAKADGASSPSIGDRSLAIFGRPLGEPRFSKRPGKFAVAPVGDRYALIDLESGVQLRRVSAVRSPAPAVFDISPDGAYLVAVSDAPSDAILSIQIVDTRTGRSTRAIRLEVGAGETHVEFLGPSKLLIAAPIADSRARRLFVYDVDQPNATLEFDTPGRLGRYVSGSHAVSPGGRQLTLGFDRSLHVFDLANGALAGTCEVPLPPGKASVGAVRSASFALNGSRLRWLVDDSDDWRAVTFDMTTGSVLASVSVSVDAEALARATGSDEDRSLTNSLPWGAEDADWLIHGQGAVDASDGTVVGPFGLHRAHAILPLQRARLLAAQVAIGSNDEAIVIHPFSPDDGSVGDQAVRSLANLRTAPSASPRPAEASPAIAASAVESGAEMPAAEMTAAEESKRAWEPTVDPPKDAEALTIASAFKGAVKNVDAFVVSEPTPGFVLSVDESDDLATLHDVRTGGIVGDSFSFEGDPRVAAVRHDGAYVAFAGEGADVVVRDIASGKETVYENRESFHELHWLAFDGNGNVVAAFTDDDDLIHVRVVRPDRLEAVQEFGVARDDWAIRNAGFAVSPGGNWLAAVRIDGLTLYDLADPSTRREAPIPYRIDRSHHPNQICEGAAFSADGRFLAALCRRLQYSFLVVWDLESGEPTTYRPYFFRSLAAKAPRAEEKGPTLRWSPDGKSILWKSSVMVDPVTGTPWWVVPNDDLVPIVQTTPSQMLAVAADGPGHKLVGAPLPIGPMEKTRKEAFAAPSEAPRPLTPVRDEDYRRVAAAPTGPAPAFEPDPASAALASAKSIEMSPHANGGSVPAFRIASTGVAIVERQVMLDTPSVGGPMSPERLSMVEAYDLASGASIGSVEVAGGSRLLAVSPDGELALCGAPTGGFNFDQIGRLDVWWPKQKKHVLSWRPVPIDSFEGEVVRWAAFVDRRHVLTFASETLTCWELPACSVVYRIPFGFFPPTSSPGGKRIVQLSEKVVRDAATGAVVTKLGGFEEGGKYRALNSAMLEGDGSSVLGVAGGLDEHFVVRWELPSGKTLEEHPVPRDVGSVSRIGEDRLLLNSMTFQDVLFSRSLGAPTDRLDIDAYGSAPGPDGSFWRVENARSVRLRRILDGDLPLPAAAPEILIVPRGSAIGLDIDSNLPDAATLRTKLARRLERSGFLVEAGAAVRAKLTMNRIEKTLRKGPPRDVVIPYVEGGIQIVAADGQVVWQDRLERMWEKPEDVDPAAWIEQHEIPQLFYRPDWGTRLEVLKVAPLE